MNHPLVGTNHTVWRDGITISVSQFDQPPIIGTEILHPDPVQLAFDPAGQLSSGVNSNT